MVQSRATLAETPVRLPTTAAVCTCMRCKADRYDSISKLNHHRAGIIERCLDVLEDVPGDTLEARLKTIVAQPPKPAWECGARKQSTAGGNDPADCDWPMCGCDPYANKVMAALDESGFELTKKVTP